MQSQRQSADSPPHSAATAHVVASSGVLGKYQHQRSPDRFDELLSASGEVRTTWSRFCQLIDSLGAEEFSRRWQHAQRLIYDNGLAYSAYGDPETGGRRWELDPLPLVLAREEWQTIAAGVAQRAQILQLVLADLFGPQRLIKERVLPAELLFAHPGFRLPYHGQEPADGRFLEFYAGDLGRSADGRWWLLADRTEAPSGIGFALENRVVISRMIPDAFRTLNVQRLAPFFIALSEKLRGLARSHRENPRVVLLSRGPLQGNYFEDAYLARYLGYTLIEGADLAIRDDRVWLKTLDGLLPVDVVWRRPNSETCDPLEFGGDPAIGVAGLLGAARSGNVAIANPLGSGLVESPVFMAFMPRLANFLLGEELMLPGVATWWCGEPKSLDHVLANLEHLVISPAFRRRGGGSPQIEQLRQLTSEQLQRKIRENPEQYVAQERLQSSLAPVWKDEQASAAQLVIRAFAVASSDAYTVMEGALGRTSTGDDHRVRIVPTGQGSKDVWIIGPDPVEPVTLLPRSDEAIALRRIGSDLPSRVADNIFWLGRQIERADATARLLRTVVLRMTSETADGSTQGLPPLLRAMAEQGQIEPGYAVQEIKVALPEIETSLPAIALGTEQRGSLRSVLDQMFQVASQVRDRLSMDTWRIFVRIDQQFKQPRFAYSVDMTDLLTVVNALVADLAAIEGMVMESMTRAYVFRFLDIGRRLERALQTVGLLRSSFIGNEGVSVELLEAVLEIADSVMTYRSRYLANLQLAAVLDLILTDETNPRSVAFQLATLQEHVDRLPRDHHQAGYSPHLKLAMSMVHAVRMVDIEHLSELHRLGDYAPLEELLDSLEKDLPNLSHEIARRYLVHSGPARKLSATPVTP